MRMFDFLTSGAVFAGRRGWGVLAVLGLAFGVALALGGSWARWVYLLFLLFPALEAADVWPSFSMADIAGGPFMVCVFVSAGTAGAKDGDPLRAIPGDRRCFGVWGAGNGGDGFPSRIAWDFFSLRCCSSFSSLRSPLRRRCRWARGDEGGRCQARHGAARCEAGGDCPHRRHEV